VTVSDCKFYGNRGSVNDTPSGGALTTWLEVVEAKVVFRRCSFVGNAGDTGAIRAYDVVLDQCRFERNYSWGEWGGAASVGGNSTVSDCVFIDNSARRAAGALYVRSPGADIARIVRCFFRDNSAGREGGAMVCEGDVDIAGCVFVGNKAITGGGGCVHSRGDAIVAQCVFAGNRAGDMGGAWSSGWRSSLEVMNCTMVGNRSSKGHSLAASLYTEEPTSPFSVRNSIFSDGGDEIWSNEVPVEVSYTCASQGIAALSDGDDWLVLGAGNIEADPCFVDAGYWDSNGTAADPNDDFFVEGDYRLKSQAGRWNEASGRWVQDDVTSPCIDAGDPNRPIGHEPFPNGGVINIGAYGGTAEASKSYFGAPLCETVIAGDINGDCRVDIADVVVLLDHWLENRRSGTSSDEN
jgi:Right handed beta helix region/Disaggregatase related